MAVNQLKGPMNISIRFWLPVAVCMGAIFYASCVPGGNIPALFSFQDAFYHLSVYAALAYFFARALKNTFFGIRRVKIILIAFIFGFIYALSDEFHQAFVPGRSASGLDLLIDSLGVILGAILYR